MSLQESPSKIDRLKQFAAIPTNQGNCSKDYEPIVNRTFLLLGYLSLSKPMGISIMLKIDLSGKIAFVTGVADDRGYGWPIAKSLIEAGATVLLGVWPPVATILEKSLSSGRLDDSRKLEDGSLMNFDRIYPLDVAYDSLEDIPEEILNNKRYQRFEKYSIQEAAELVAEEYGHIDILVHSVANASEVKQSLLDTSRKGYLHALSTSSYSLISLLKHFGPFMNQGGSCVSLSFLAAERTVPGYGGGMSTSKAALESDTRTLAFDAGRRWGIRVNTISAGAIESRAGSAIGFIKEMRQYQAANAPILKEFEAEEVGKAAAFLLSPLASGITGTTLYVDNGMHTMAVAVDSPSLSSS